MRKFLLSLMCLVSAVCISRAESGDIAVGVQMGHGSYWNQIGLGAKVQVSFSDALRLEPAFNYYFRQDDMATWDVDVNLHYLFDVADSFAIYPLGGLFVSNWDLKGAKGSETRFGANLGAGAEYAITDVVSLGGELRYMLTGDFRQLVTSVGVTFRF